MGESIACDVPGTGLTRRGIEKRTQRDEAQKAKHPPQGRVIEPGDAISGEVNK
ncbi:MAG: hypothetical protein JSU63_21370 [Phycisphaerales bacterium]|nr:MAG: hypothetical protein JSU63_21370 [Phycisphaerales bacterium]